MREPAYGQGGELDTNARQSAWVQHHLRFGATYDVTIVCEHCGKEFSFRMAPNTLKTKPRYCTLTCRTKAQVARRQAKAGLPSA